MNGDRATKHDTLAWTTGLHEAFRTLCMERRAVTALEYGIVAAFLCLSLLGIFRAFGSVLVAMFSGVSTTL